MFVFSLCFVIFDVCFQFVSLIVAVQNFGELISICQVLLLETWSIVTVFREKSNLLD